MALKRMIPLLNISDIHRSLAFYQDALAFEVVSDPDMVSEWRWATIRSGQTELMLSECEDRLPLELGIDPQQNTRWPAIYYFYPEDVTQLHEQLRDSGYQTTDLITTIYGMREFSMQDPDGHMLSFGQDVVA